MASLIKTNLRCDCVNPFEIDIHGTINIIELIIIQFYVDNTLDVLKMIKYYRCNS